MRAPSDRPMPSALRRAIVLAAVVAALGGSRAAIAQPSETSARAASSTHAGEAVCAGCHPRERAQFQKTPHANATDASGASIDCETCHGAGRAHADAMAASRGDDAAVEKAKALIDALRAVAPASDSRCRTCHTGVGSATNFAHAPHMDARVSCQSCHAVHRTEGPVGLAARQPSVAGRPAPSHPDDDGAWLQRRLLAAPQATLCYACHANVRTQFAQPFHHRVPEGAIVCSECHRPAGAASRYAPTTVPPETCTRCHADKRGPFVFEHAAVRVEGCAICHTPHGSTSRFLLQRRESRFLCLQCHGEPHSDQTSVPHGRLGFQARGDCVRCHVSIHGSNVDPSLLR